MALSDVLDEGDLNKLAAAFKDGKLGSHMAAGNGARPFSESVAVVANVATPKFPVLALLGATVSGGTAGNGGKICDPLGATSAATHATPNAAGTSVAMFAGEVTGPSAVVQLTYMTTAAPVGPDGKNGVALTAVDPGLYQ